MIITEIEDDDSQLDTKNIKLWVESELRKVEQIQYDRTASKVDRKKCTGILTSIIQTSNVDALCIYNLLSQIVKYCIHLFHDDSEMIRQSTVENIILLLEKTNGSKVIFKNLLPALELRLGQDQIVETCEEIRLCQINIIYTSLQKYQTLTEEHLGSMCSILKRSLQDSFYSIRILSNEILIMLISNYSVNMGHFCELLLPPLINSLNQPQSKIREKTVKSMLRLLKVSAPELLRKNLSYVVQRCFDENIYVRKTLCLEIYDYLANYRDRYSFFNLLIPIYFGFLDDEDEHISKVSQENWERLGVQFVAENETDLKEEIDYQTRTPDQYIKGARRPNLGCRELVGRNIIGMLPALARDCNDNLNVNNREMASNVLTHVIQHAERVIHQHVPKFIEIISNGLLDSSAKVRANHKKTALWLCVLADNNLILEMLLPKFQDLSIGTLTILEKLTEISESSEHLSSILETVNQAVSVFYREDKVIQIIQKINLNLSRKLTTLDFNHQYIFNIETFCQSLTSKNVQFNDDTIMNLVYKTFTTKREVLDKYGSTLVRKLAETVQTWNTNSSEYAAWVFLLQLCCYEGADCAIEASTKNFDHLLTPKNDNVSVRLMVLEMTFDLVSTNKHVFKSISNRMVSLVTKNIVYRAGRSETATRMLAVSVLCYIVLELEPRDRLSWYKAFQENLRSCTEDDEIVTRLNTMYLLVNILQSKNMEFDYDALKDLCVLILQRLDDTEKRIRVLAAQCAGDIYKELNRLAEYESQMHSSFTEYSLPILFLHLDDNDDDIKHAVHEAIRALHELDPEQVKKYASAESKQALIL